MNKHVISFNNGCDIVTQEIVITEEGLSIEDLVDGLEKGDYLTTVGHATDTEGWPTIDRFDDNGFTPVAEIRLQQIESDSTYTDFKIVN